jgi:hypothetical protein
LLSLTSNKVSLEQVFLRLTEATDNNEARRMLGIEVQDETVDEAEESIEPIETEEAAIEEEN